MEIKNVTIDVIRKVVNMIIVNRFPSLERLNGGHYTIADLENQIIFELIKEEYKEYAPRNTIEYYLGEYDPEASHRKYTRAIQYAQHYRDDSNNIISEMFGFEIEELLPQDMSGSRVFEGHKFTEQEFWQLWLEDECKLFKKMHGHQIDKTKNVSDTQFEELFEQYVEKMDNIEPPVNAPDLIIGRTFVLFGIETHFMIDFLYRLTLAAEKHGFPKEIPVERILAICGMDWFLPATYFFPDVFAADNCMLLKWDSFCDNVFSDTEEEWELNEAFLYDCKRIKSIVVQNGTLGCTEESSVRLIDFIHMCSREDKVNFVLENYWIWEKRICEFEWTPERKSYYRKLHSAITREFKKPKVN